MPASKARVRPLRVLLPDDELRTNRLHGIGFGVTCDCGERSPRCASVAMARGWLAEHRRGCNNDPNKGANR